MDNYIFLTGIELWLFVFFIALVAVSSIVVGFSYVKERREKEHWHQKYRSLCRQYSYLQLNAEMKGVKFNADRSKE